MTRLSTLIAVLLSLVAALIDVESSGRDNVIDPTGRCWGPLQITQIYIDDVNRILGRHEYDRSDAFDRARSIQMFEVYVGHYATAERIGRTPTDEDRARDRNYTPGCACEGLIVTPKGDAKHCGCRVAPKYGNVMSEVCIPHDYQDECYKEYLREKRRNGTLLIDSEQPHSKETAHEVEGQSSGSSQEAKPTGEGVVQVHQQPAA